MKILPLLLLLLASRAGAQSFASMGRLFTTPAERAQLDAQRNQAPALALGGQYGAGGPGSAGGTAAGSAAPGMSAATPCVAGAAPGCPATDAAQGAAGGAAPGLAAAPTPGQADAGEPGLRLNGVIRRSHGPTVLIVNGEVQPAPAGSITRGAVTLTADGRSVVLKPGQRFDPATGEVHEAAR